MIRKIMVVDDSPFMRMIIKDILRDINKGYKVVVARNGEDALKKLEREKVDLITLDIEMPS
jgi:two-component system chemotaxis response regulator CheB